MNRKPLKASSRARGARMFPAAAALCLVATACASPNERDVNARTQAVERVFDPTVVTKTCQGGAAPGGPDEWVECGDTVGIASQPDAFAVKFPDSAPGQQGTDELSPGEPAAYVCPNSGAGPCNARIVAIHAALTHIGELLYFSGDGYDRDKHAGEDLQHYGIFDSQNYGYLGIPEPNIPLVGTPGSVDLFCSGHSTLQTGRVLAAGGMGYDNVPGNYSGWRGDRDELALHFNHFIGGTQSASYDPTLRTWRDEGRLIETLTSDGQDPDPGEVRGGGRWYPSLFALSDGRVSAHWGHVNNDIASGGADVGVHTNNTAESFDPAGGLWSFLGFEADQSKFIDTNELANTSGPTYPRAHLLPNGLLLRATPTLHSSLTIEDPADFTSSFLNSVLDPNIATSRRNQLFITHAAAATPFASIGSAYSPTDNNTRWKFRIAPTDA